MKNSIYSLIRTGLFVLIILFFVHSDSKAQNSAEIDKSIPAWVKMMDDPNVNYYEAVKAYDEYWKSHTKPEDEEEEMAEGKSNFREMEREIKKEQKRDKNRILTEAEIRAMNEQQQMRYQMKRFKQWKRDVFPYVQEDGRILSEKERMEIWNKQQDEIRRQQK